MNPPPIPPHSEFSGLVSRHRSAITPDRLNFSSRRDPPPIPTRSEPQECKDKQRELEEMKARVTQMEKTLRWWSECTTEWRKKWAKVKEERNEALADCRRIRSEFERLKAEQSRNTLNQRNMTNSLKDDLLLSNGNHVLTRKEQPDNCNFLMTSEDQSKDKAQLANSIDINLQLHMDGSLVEDDICCNEKSQPEVLKEVATNQDRTRFDEKMADSKILNELSETRSMLIRLKKTFIDKNSENEDNKSKYLQQENENKMLTNRVDQLKNRLTSIERQLEAEVLERKKLQRNNEDLIQQNANQNKQIQSLRTKLRRFSSSVGGAASSLHNAHDIPSDDGSVDCCNDVD